MKPLHLPCLLLLALTACMHEEYDTSDGIDTKIRLFEEEISMPVGNIGPITVESTVGETLKDFLVADENGLLWAKTTDMELYTVNVYEIKANTADTSTPFTWNPGTKEVGPSGMAGLLAAFGLLCKNQEVTVKVFNPLRDAVTLNSTLSGYCMNWTTYMMTWMDSKPLSGVSLPSNKTTELGHFDIPSDDVLANVSLDDLALDLPANPHDRIKYSSQPSFEFKCDYKCNIAAGETFTFEQAFTIDDANLALGSLSLKKAIVKLQAVNTLPLNVEFKSLDIINPVKEDGSWGGYNENVKISENVMVAGGSTESPTTSDIILEFEALEGTLPDIHQMRLVVEISAAASHAHTLLSANQGLYIKNATAKVIGGITLFGNE